MCLPAYNAQCGGIAFLRAVALSHICPRSLVHFYMVCNVYYEIWTRLLRHIVHILNFVLHLVLETSTTYFWAWVVLSQLNYFYYCLWVVQFCVQINIL